MGSHRNLAFLLSFLAAAGCARGQESTEATPPEALLSDLDHPESFQFDPATGWYFVSCIVGKPGEKDGNGEVVRFRLAEDGKPVDVRLDFVRGGKNGVTLHAPKGIAFDGSHLWVTDVDHVRAFDKETGAPGPQIEIPDAKFLNDLVASPDGAFYVSDTMEGKIFRVEPHDGGRVSVYSEEERLANPNGLALDPGGSGRLLVLTWKTGELLQVHANGTTGLLVKLSEGGLDGIVWLEGAWYVTDYKAGKVLVAGEAGPRVIFEGKAGLADLGTDGKRLLVPSMEEGKVFLLSPE
ncbi:MAG: hypothetical protein HY720_13400 [Planctomycetes bacterium]|nr:hypothetical protein [Planctomycetota bacterium]